MSLGSVRENVTWTNLAQNCAEKEVHFGRTEVRNKICGNAAVLSSDWFDQPKLYYLLPSDKWDMASEALKDVTTGQTVSTQDEGTHTAASTQLLYPCFGVL